MFTYFNSKNQRNPDDFSTIQNLLGGYWGELTCSIGGRAVAPLNPPPLRTATACNPRDVILPDRSKIITAVDEINMKAISAYLYKYYTEEEGNLMQYYILNLRNAQF
jgi:hypothetical protein